VLEGGRIASGSSDGTVRVWNPDTGDSTVVTRHDHAVWALAVLEGGRIASGSSDGTVRVWNPDTGDTTVVTRHDRAVRALAVLEGGRLASGSEDGTVRVWSPNHHEVGPESDSLGFAFTSPVWSLVTLDRHRDLLAAGLRDGHVLVWAVEPEAARAEGAV
jgi:WD40 repeat protein